jgi:hypothetical protein
MASMNKRLIVLTALVLTLLAGGLRFYRLGASSKTSAEALPRSSLTSG